MVWVGGGQGSLLRRRRRQRRRVIPTVVAGDEPSRLRRVGHAGRERWHWSRDPPLVLLLLLRPIDAEVSFTHDAARNMLRRLLNLLLG